MPNYRRDLTPGGMYFFTVALRDRASALLVDRIDDLRDAVRETRSRMPFEIVAWVVLPEHLHAVWKMPEYDGDYSVRWGMIKSRFSRRVSAAIARNASRQRRREGGIWQRRFWEHRIRDEDDLRTHFDYIHFNPVKHEHCERVVDWPHSTFHRWVRQGHYAPDWGIGECRFDGSFGE
ncbi:MAG: transposase [Wenzhouxiangellaceae bacterium]|nr:transposase [Wenzhouxiangellaceae bacterium]MBS3823005.1 transposase [Wenzhouxiangellaceae bacterium]